MKSIASPQTWSGVTSVGLKNETGKSAEKRTSRPQRRSSRFGAHAIRLNPSPFHEYEFGLRPVEPVAEIEEEKSTAKCISHVNQVGYFVRQGKSSVRNKSYKQQQSEKQETNLENSNFLIFARARLIHSKSSLNTCNLLAAQICLSKFGNLQCR